VAARLLPTDHDALRARYNASYLEYLTSFHRLVTQKGKLDNLLKSTDLESIGSITDSEGDMELLGPEELSQLATKHKRLEEELEAIQEVFRVV
jgi:RNA polymerase II elongation factor ELL